MSLFSLLNFGEVENLKSLFLENQILISWLQLRLIYLWIV